MEYAQYRENMQDRNLWATPGEGGAALLAAAGDSQLRAGERAAPQCVPSSRWMTSSRKRWLASCRRLTSHIAPLTNRPKSVITT
ncbi:MAG: hypothetical protein AW07_02653 [Candidatus Accumulibacter sp. SK-11]|nr:MAG: hypothetical protein AW07_02653 [Candidatus Accumulibacter sp. SK-11]